MARRKKAPRLLSASKRNPNPRDVVNLENELFLEASKLSAATGAKVAVVCRRPTGQVRIWGYPSAQSVINEYKQYSRRHSLEEVATTVPAVVQAVEARRPEEELKGTMASDLTAEEQSATDREWMLESLGRQIERVRKRIQELAAVGGKAEQPTQVSLDETGV